MSGNLLNTLLNLGDKALQAQALSSADYPLRAFKRDEITAVAQMMEAFSPEQLTSVLKQNGVAGDLIMGDAGARLERMLHTLNTKQQGEVFLTPYFLSNLVEASYGDTAVRILQNLAPEQQSAILANNRYDCDRLRSYSYEKKVLRDHGYWWALRKIEANIRHHEKMEFEKFIRTRAQEYDAQHGAGAYQKKYYPTLLDTVRTNITDLWNMAKTLTAPTHAPAPGKESVKISAPSPGNAPQQTSPERPEAQAKKPAAASTPSPGQ